MIGEFPSLDGKFHVSLICVDDVAVAVNLVGDAGSVVGTIVTVSGLTYVSSESLLGVAVASFDVLFPAPIFALTLYVYDVFVSNPDTTYVSVLLFVSPIVATLPLGNTFSIS